MGRGGGEKFRYRHILFEFRHRVPPPFPRTLSSPRPLMGTEGRWVGLGWVCHGQGGGGHPGQPRRGPAPSYHFPGGSLGPREGPGRVVQLPDAGRCVLRPLELHHRCGDTESGIQNLDLTCFRANLAQKKNLPLTRL